MFAGIRRAKNPNERLFVARLPPYYEKIQISAEATNDGIVVPHNHEGQTEIIKLTPDTTFAGLDHPSIMRASDCYIVAKQPHGSPMHGHRNHRSNGQWLSIKVMAEYLRSEPEDETTAMHLFETTRKKIAIATSTSIATLEKILKTPGLIFGLPDVDTRADRYQYQVCGQYSDLPQKRTRYISIAISDRK